MTNMDVGDADVADAERFIGKWKGSAASELSTSQSFLIDLCELLGVDRPHATAEQDYMFERPLTLPAAEEPCGHIRWLRPDFQNPQATPVSQQAELNTHTTGEADDRLTEHMPASSKRNFLPKDSAHQVRAVTVPPSIEDIGSRFTARNPWKKRLPKLLEMLVALARAEAREGGVVGTRH